MQNLSNSPAAASQQFRVGLIVPSSNTVMEPHFHRFLSHRANVSTTRILLEDVTREAEEKMLSDELAQALRLIKTVNPHVLVFGCTSAGSLGGIDHDRAIGHSIEDVTGVPTLTVVGSVIAQLKELRPQRVAVFTPYQPELTRSVAACIFEAGFDIGKAAGMGLVSNRDVGAVTPEEVFSFVEHQFSGVDADCIFLSCTNWRGLDATDRLRRELNVNVVSSNRACIDEILRLVDSRMPEAGLLANAREFSQKPS
jgi:maleate isomerase